MKKLLQHRTRFDGFQPVRPITIDEPCNASWEAMPGDVAGRFCGRCDKDVLDTTAMTPAAVNDLLSRPGAVPCVRVMQYEDGSIVTARATPSATFTRRAMIAASAFVSLAALTGCTKPEPVVGAMAPMEEISSIGGEVVRADGSPAVGVRVEVTAGDGRHSAPMSATTDGKGWFHMMAPAGEWSVQALSGSRNAEPAGGIELASEPVKASPRSGRHAQVSLRLRSVQPLMGKMMPPPVKTVKQPSGR